MIAFLEDMFEQIKGDSVDANTAEQVLSKTVNKYSWWKKEKDENHSNGQISVKNYRPHKLPAHTGSTVTDFRQGLKDCESQ